MGRQKRMRLTKTCRKWYQRCHAKYVNHKRHKKVVISLAKYLKKQAITSKRKHLYLEWKKLHKANNPKATFDSDQEEDDNDTKVNQNSQIKIRVKIKQKRRMKRNRKVKRHSE